MKAIKLFKYRKSNEGYWNKPKLYKQVANKALPIIKALYPGYSQFFFGQCNQLFYICIRCITYNINE